MINSKHLHKFLLIILIMTFCNKSEETCGHHKHHLATTTTPKYDLKIHTRMTSNPEIKDLNPKAVNDAENKRNVLVSIIKSSQGNLHKPHTTTKDKIATTTARPISTTTPHQSTNIQVTNHVVNGHSYVYNIQNHGTHYHYYGSPGTDKTNPHKIDIVH